MVFTAGRPKPRTGREIVFSSVRRGTADQTAEKPRIRRFVSKFFCMTGSVVTPLPLGRSTFAALRAAGAVYVDKTDLVAELAAEDRKIFLVRPRRFGKSLLLSTFGSLFEAGLRDFEGLAISSVWTDRTYDVVRLDFSEVREFSDADDFKKKFSRLLRRSFSRVGVGMSDSDEPAEDRIALWMAGLPVRSLVVLIDEYDAPLTVCLNDAVLFKDVQAVMSEFFSLLKSQEGCLRFLFMTGITKFSSTSIFSAFNKCADKHHKYDQRRYYSL